MVDMSKWLETADLYALERFGISATDVNGGEAPDEWDMENYTPDNWVDYKAEKYDLISRDRWMTS